MKCILCFSLGLYQCVGTGLFRGGGQCRHVTTPPPKKKKLFGANASPQIFGKNRGKIGKIRQY